MSAAPTHATNPEASPVPTHIRPRTARLIAHRLARPPRIRVTRVLSGRSGTCSPFALDSPASNTRSGGRSKGSDCSTELSHAVRWFSGALARADGAGAGAERKRRFEETLYRELELRCSYHWHPRAARERLQVDRQRHLHRPCARAGRVPPRRVDAALLPRPVVMFINPGDVRVQFSNSNKARRPACPQT